MATLQDAKIDLEEGNLVKVAMKCGRLTLKPATHEWINSTTKIKHPGLTLNMKNVENGGDGYCELDLDDEHDRKVYAELEKFLQSGDSRIKKHGVKVLAADAVALPLPWWHSAQWKTLLSDVMKAVRAMKTTSQREAFVLQCVKYEKQQDNPREGLIRALLAVELDGVPESDPLTVPED